jgi:hypothetical protein
VRYIRSALHMYIRLCIKQLFPNDYPCLRARGEGVAPGFLAVCDDLAGLTYMHPFERDISSKGRIPISPPGLPPLIGHKE